MSDQPQVGKIEQLSDKPISKELKDALNMIERLPPMSLTTKNAIAEEIKQLKAERDSLKETLREICEWALALTDDPQLQSNANIGQLRVLCEGQLRRLDKEE